MDLDIKGLRVIVTAGANGIGLAIARAFAGEGARVHVCDVDTAALSALASDHPTITQTHCDVADRSAVQNLFAEATEKLGGLDVLVNNAGIAGPTAKVEEMHPEDWDRCLDICLTGQFNCTRLAVPLLRLSPNASIVNLSSAAGRVGFAMRTPYSAAKWGVIGFTNPSRSSLGRTTSASMLFFRGSSRAIARDAFWKPRRNSVEFPSQIWRRQHSPTHRSKTTSRRNRLPTRSCSCLVRADARFRGRQYRFVAIHKC
ncbi:MAG: 3-oxoacyl-[acyl-carrier-protein] reductase [Tardiphaga sp.]|nr:3-oxoacyl-[acyl-carrier-protein] reductase [Tardiphaga sp.]